MARKHRPPRQRRIRRIIKTHVRHPYDALWAWADNFGHKHSAGKQATRFIALRKFAHNMGAYAREHNNYAEAKRWAKRHDIWDRAAKRRLKTVQEHERERRRRHHRQHDGGDGSNFVMIDNRLVPRWIYEIDMRARKAGVYFVVISGFRTPEYSRELCILMCGQPYCPGRCAGDQSNHACPPSGTGVPYEGAEDVSPGYQALRAYCESHHEPLIGGGAVLGTADLPHFSHDGR